MRVFIAVLVLIFSFQSWTKAEDISEFEIEGMSIGDSLLNFYSKNKIKKSTMENTYKDKSFDRLEFIEKFEIYDAVLIHTKKDDPDHIIYMLSGVLDFPNRINDCERKKNEIVDVLKKIFTSAKVEDYGKVKHNGDPSGKSFLASISFISDKKDYTFAQVQCFDWAKKMGYKDHLRVKLLHYDYFYWLRNKAWK